MPDALDLDHERLQRVIDGKPRMLIKALLIDQKVLRGIGNAYADEILWQARVSPRLVAGKLPPEAVEALAAAIRSVLIDAIRHLRTEHPGIIAGNIREFLVVHNPARKQSPGGSPIRVETVSSKRRISPIAASLHLVLVPAPGLESCLRLTPLLSWIIVYQFRHRQQEP